MTQRAPAGDDRIETLRAALDEAVWTQVSRELLAKMLAEFAYEDVIDPAVDPGDGEFDRYRLDFGDVAYRYLATERLFDSYHVDPQSVERRCDGAWEPATDPIQFLLDARETIGVDQRTASHLIREYNNTLVADAHIAARKARADDGASILDQSYAEIEGEMEGHPWFTISKGRIGFDYDDYRQYAPESKEPQSIQWVGARRDRASFSSVDGLSYDALLDQHLGEHRGQFRDKLRGQGLDPDAYYLLPVHQWQWSDTLTQLFAKDIARDDLVPLGTGPNTYLPQQSIRTLTNVDDPTKPHVKLPIRVLNTIVYRGLPGEQALAAPAVTEAITAIRDDDPYLRDECRLLLPGEVASLNYDHSEFDQLSNAPYQYHELLGAVWRESVQGLVADGEQPLTLAALMHEDFDGQPLVSKLADRAGCSLSTWLDDLFDTVLHPLLHHLYRYGLVFMPHGTNTIVVLDDGMPSRIAIKDYVDEVAVAQERVPEMAAFPNEIYEHPDIVHQKPPEALSQHILGTVFICVFRYVSNLLERRADYDEQRFWRQVRHSIERYQAQFPELESRFERFDLFAPEFAKVCLNRNRLLEYGYENRHEEPQVQAHGTVENALVTVAEDDSPVSNSRPVSED